MPDPTTGQFQLQDFVAELKSRGFDGFSDADLKVLVNRAYFAVARKHRWMWERTSSAFLMLDGQTNIDLSGNALINGELRVLDRLYNTTSGKNKRLKPMDEDEFFQDWLSQDLTNSRFRGETDHYFLFNSLLYLLPVVNSTQQFTVYYHRRVVAMVGDSDLPLTPVDLDEAIIQASLVRVHQRSSEPTLASVARADLEELYDDMRDEEEHENEELPDRIRPDDTWL